MTKIDAKEYRLLHNSQYSDQLRSLFEQIERLEEEKQTITEFDVLSTGVISWAIADYTKEYNVAIELVLNLDHDAEFAGLIQMLNRYRE